jgi:hypothetical protein
MSRRWVVLMMSSLALVSGCGGAGNPRADGSPGTTSLAASPTTSSPVIGKLYLDRDDCVREEKVAGKVAYPEVDCADLRATAKVLSRYLVDIVPDLHRSECSEDADLLVSMAESLRALNEHTRDEKGYGCLRNLKGPHPSDPGRGGGAGYRVGDCFKVTEQKYGSALTRLLMGGEVPCKGTDRQSIYRIVKITTGHGYEDGDCPGSSQEFRPTSVLGGSNGPDDLLQFYCAVER